MSFGSIGAVGRPDDQGLQQWISTAPIWRNHGLVVGTQLSPIFPTSVFGYTYVFHHNPDTQSQVLINWAVDAAMTDIVGGRQYGWDPLVLNGAEIVYRNLAPFAQVQTQPQGGAGANWHDNTYVLLTNHPSSTLNVADGQSAGSFGGTIVAGGSRTDQLVIMGMGNLWAYTKGGDQGIKVSVQYLPANYVYTEFASWTVAANTVDMRTLGVPYAAIRAVITNASAVNPCVGSQDTWIPYATA